MTPDLFARYQARGFALCRIPPGAKSPRDRGWQLHPIQRPEDFGADDAVGLILGPLSGGLVGADLDFHSDDSEAWEAAESLLPLTGLIDGRPGKPRAHRVYALTDTTWPDSLLPRPGCETRAAMDAGTLPRFVGTRHFSNGNGRAIDLLGAGSQLVIPPSHHAASGTCRVWWGDAPGEPARIAYADLLQSVLALADRLGLKIPATLRSEDMPAPPDPAHLAHIPVDDRTRRLSAYLGESPPLAHGLGQEFHAQQWRIACMCAELGVPFEQALPLYLAWNRASSTPDPDPANEATLANAYRTAVFGARLNDAGPTVDLSGILRPTAPASLASTPAPEDQDPGPIPMDLLRVPGFVGAVMDHCLATAPYPNQAMAFCGALALQAFLAGRKVREPGGLRTNLYLLGLAHSSSGKDWPRKLNTQILHHAGLSTCLGDKFASGEGLQDALLATPAMLFQTDEIDGLLQSINKAQDARHEGILGALLTFYTSADSVVPMRRKAGQQAPGVIDQPCLVIFGTAIPNHYYEALSRRMLTNGFFARTIVVEGGKRGLGQDAGPVDPPEHILAVAKYWAEYRPSQGNLFTEHPVPAVVPTTSDAAAILLDCRKEADDAYARCEGRNDSVGTTVWGRVNEQARRLALIHAVSANHQDPMIDAAAATWATRFVLHQTRRMLFMAGGHVAENPFHADCLRFIEKLREAPQRTLDHSVVLKRMKMKTRDFQEVVEALVEQGDVEVVIQPTAGRPNKQYRMTTTGIENAYNLFHSRQGDSRSPGEGPKSVNGVKDCQVGKEG